MTTTDIETPRDLLSEARDVIEDPISDGDVLEHRTREQLKTAQSLLRDLREQRLLIDAAVRRLVADEKTLKRVIAVYDRANAKTAS